MKKLSIILAVICVWSGAQAVADRPVQKAPSASGVAALAPLDESLVIGRPAFGQTGGTPSASAPRAKRRAARPGGASVPEGVFSWVSGG
jgi:hypothetical protein